MRLYFLCIAAYLLLGAVGMAVSNKKVDPQIRKQRWLKYGTYVLITATVIASIIADIFSCTVLIITAFSFYELARIFYAQKNKTVALLAIINFSVIAFGLWGFAEWSSQIFLLTIYLQVLTFDAFSQIVGQLLGRYQLAPRISPSKTAEGLAGGITFCIFSSVVLHNWLRISFFSALLLGLFTAIFSFTGDILASYFKRKVSIKDYSKLLPGQGGFLDRFDSLLMTGAAYFALYIFQIKASLSFLDFLSKFIGRH